MSSRFSSGIALATLALCFVRCFSYSQTASGDPDFRDRFRRATNEIVKRSTRAEEAALKGQRASVDPKVEQFVQRHFCKADELVLVHMSAVKKALDASANSFGSFPNVYEKRRTTLLDFTLKLQPSLDIVESKFANATAFPSGRILLSRPLAEAFDVDKDGFDSVLLGILIHELIHVRDGHALEQWATSDSRKVWARDRALGALSSMTALIPFLSIEYDIRYPLTFGAAKQLPALSEYAADLGAVSLLDSAAFDSGRYIAFLSEMSADMTEAASKTGPKLLRQRVACLANFSKNRFDGGLAAIVIGSSNAGDNMVQMFDLTVYPRIASLLDSPEALATQFPVTPEVSDADRRNLLLTLVRKSAYLECAIKYSFPEVALPCTRPGRVGVRGETECGDLLAVQEVGSPQGSCYLRLSHPQRSVKNAAGGRTSEHHFIHVDELRYPMHLPVGVHSADLCASLTAFLNAVFVRRG